MEYNEEIAATISIRAVDLCGGKQTNVCWMLVYLVLIKHEIIYIVSARCSYISYLLPSLCDLLGSGKIENMFLLTIPSPSHSHILYDGALLGINFMKRKIYLINFDQDLDCQLSRGAVTAD